MKVGEIKLQTLVIMNVATDTKLELNMFDNYLYENKYKKYLLNMNDSIRRAVDIINKEGVLEEKIVPLNSYNYEKRAEYIILTLSQIEDFSKIKKIVSFNDDVKKLNYEQVADKLIIYTKGNYENMFIAYYPKIVLPKELNNTDEMPMPDNLSRVIPYFIKYDLYQEDEPNLAMVAKSNFDTMLENFKVLNQSEQSSIETIYEV